MLRTLIITRQITKRETPSFSKYLQDVTRISKENTSLTSDEEVELSMRIKEGDRKAEEELIKRNLRFVISVAKQHQTDGINLEDLVSEGNYGLIKAARRFDHTKGYKFISYAVWWIRQAIFCYINENLRGIRLPLNKINQLGKIKKIEDKFEQEFYRKPDSEEIAELLDYETSIKIEDKFEQEFHRKPSPEELEELIKSEMSVDDIDKIRLIDRGCQSISAEISTNTSKYDAVCLEDLMFDNTAPKTDEILDRDDLKSVLASILNRMPPNYKAVIEMSFGLNGGEPKSLDEIAAHLDLTRERIRQIKVKALQRLNSKTNYKLVMQYIN